MEEKAVAVQDKGRATVEIFGEEYKMKGNATPEYMAMLAKYIDKKMKQIASRQPQLPVAKVAVLTALNIADEMSKLQEDYDTLVKLMDREKKDYRAAGKKEDKKYEKRYDGKQA